MTSTLQGGVLTDSRNSVGEIVANYQFQYDVVPQDGNKATSGFGVCDGNLALNGNTDFYQCFDTNRTVIYSPEYPDAESKENCYKVNLPIVPCSGQGAVSQSSDGQPAVTPTSECVPISQTVDGQLQVTPCPTSAAVGQISDGQLQVSSCVPFSQLVDGQLQYSPCPTTTASAAVGQISDGQLQVSSSQCIPVSQIVDGQLQVSSCPTSSATGTGVPAATASNTFITAGISAGNSLVGSQAAAAIVALVAVAFL